MSNKEFRLKESKVFCMAPWVHVHNMPNGDIQPCCIAAIGKPMGNLYEDEIEVIWNNDNYKTFRKNMLNEIPAKNCDRCLKEEEWGNTNTIRNFYNNLYGKKYEELVEEGTEEDGSMKEMKIYRWDFRFSNLCNLACTPCSTKYSSAWVDVVNKMWPLNATTEKFNTSSINKEKFINTIKSQAKYADDVYLAGGEPLIQPEHFAILKAMDEAGKFDDGTHFCYSTNLTSLKYKDIDVLEYWARIKKLKILVSMDEVDRDRLHYSRYPLELDTIVKNLHRLNNALTGSQQSWTLTPTWSIMNTHRMKEMVEFLSKENLLSRTFYDSSEWEVDFHNIILMHPEHLSISCATPEWKEFLHNSLREFQEWYVDVMVPLKNVSVRESAITTLHDNIERFHKAIDEPVIINHDSSSEWFNKLDEARGTNFLKTFPELSWHPAAGTPSFAKINKDI